MLSSSVGLLWMLLATGLTSGAQPPVIVNIVLGEEVIGQCNLDPNEPLISQLKRELRIDRPNSRSYQFLLSNQSHLKEYNTLSDLRLGDESSILVMNPVIEVSRILNGLVQFWHETGYRQSIIPDLEKFRDIFAQPETLTQEILKKRFRSWLNYLQVRKPKVLRLMMRVLNLAQPHSENALDQRTYQLFEVLRESLILNETPYMAQRRIMLDQILTFIEGLGGKADLYDLQFIMREQAFRNQAMIQKYLKLFDKHRGIRGDTALIVKDLAGMSISGNYFNHKLLEAFLAKEPGSITGDAANIKSWSDYFQGLNLTQQSQFINQLNSQGVVIGNF